jgi:hypothetical protein
MYYTNSQRFRSFWGIFFIFENYSQISFSQKLPGFGTIKNDFPSLLVNSGHWDSDLGRHEARKNCTIMPLL